MNCLKLKIGIIGAGVSGGFTPKYSNQHREAEIKSIADILNDSLEKWAYSIGINHVYRDHRKIIEDPDIDAVLICSPTDTHSKFIIEAAQAGKHIFCEKPIDFDVKRIEEALNAVEKAKVKLQIGFNRRFDHNFRKIRSILKGED